MKNIRTIFSNRDSEKRACYVVPDGGLGILYTLAYVAVLRLLKFRIFLRYHSYSFIRDPSVFMRILLRLSGKETTHIFLDEVMARELDSEYRVVTRKLILGNAALNDVQVMRKRPKQGRITISYLSNLTIDKGFEEVAEAFIELHKRERFHFLLAGEPVSRKERRILAELRARLGDDLDHLGAVYSDQKADFFCRSDIFLFPTKYRQEAQPNVVYEALATGCYVIATSKAGIPAMLRGIPSTLVAEGPGLTNRLVSAVEDACENADWETRSEEIIQRYERVQKEAVGNLDHALAVITGHTQ